MQNPSQHKRAAGTGSLRKRTDAAGRVTYYGQWRANGRKVKRALGRAKSPICPDGLTKKQAEAALRKAMADDALVATGERVTLAEAGRRLTQHLEALGRSPRTTHAMATAVRVHLVPFFGDRPLERITRQEIERFIFVKRRAGLAVKTIRNYLSHLHSIYEYAIRQDWVVVNPCKKVDKPDAPPSEEIRFLSEEELEALLRQVPDDTLGSVEGPLYLTAAMTGLRQGELFALRWQDVDWAAGLVRVRRSWCSKHREFRPPKSRRGERGVPLGDRVAGELDRHFQQSPWTGDEDLVFAHPLTGRALDSSKVLKRMKDALTRGRIGGFERVTSKNGKVVERPRIRFHDLRHTYATRMAAAGTNLRDLQEWMGHRDYKTTLIYADYQPNERGVEMTNRAFAPAPEQVAA